MRILTDLDFNLEDTAVCIGKFDGIHRGHRMLLRGAAESGLPTVMLTFLFPDYKGIYSYEEKLYLAEKLGIDFFVPIPVTKEFMHMSPEQFAADILTGRCHAQKVIVGSDFRFGYKRLGTPQTLQESGREHGFEVSIMDKLKWDGEVVSSTRIRGLLSDGKMEQANALLETPYFIKGKVEEGNKIGRTMSVPTANIRPSDEKCLPPFGVYAVRVQTGADGSIYNGVCNLGVKPTIPGKNPVGAEVWLFDYDGNLYGKELMISLYAFQRPERAFDSIGELKKQIVKDTEEARRILAEIL